VSQPRQRDPLTAAFARLPRQRPSAGFTDELLAELNRRGPVQRRPTGRLVWATVMSLIVAAMLAVGYGYQKQQAAKRAYRDQVEELRSRYEELLDEVASVRQEVATPETRLYLGGDESVDLVLDLSQTPTYQTNRQDLKDVRPAALEQ